MINEKRNNWKPVDCVMFVVVVTICAAVLIGAGQVLFHRDDLHPQAHEALTGIFASLIAILSMWVGARIRRHRDDDEEAPRKE